MKSLQPLAELAQITAEVEEHLKDALVGRVIAVVVHVGLHLSDTAQEEKGTVRRSRNQAPKFS